MVWLLVLLLSAGVFGFPGEKILTASLRSLLDHLLPQMPPCLVVIYSDATDPFLQLPPDLLAIRVQGNSSHLRAALLASYTMKCNGYITDAAIAEDFLTSLGSARLEAPERHTPRVLVLPSRRVEPGRGCRLLSHPEAAYIPDILVVSVKEIGQESAVLSLFTNSFTNDRKNSCTLLGLWPSTIEGFFPDKTRDLRGKEIFVATLDYPPYSLFSPTFDGMEVRIMLEFCVKHNCTVIPVTDEYLWGEIYDNGTGTGVAGNVYMDRADFGVGALYLWEELYSYIDFSYPYLNTKVTALVPKPTRLPEWTIPFLPFSKTLWAIQLSSLTAAAAIMFAVNKAAPAFTRGLRESVIGGEFSSFGGAMLRVLAMSVLQPPPSRLPVTSPLRRFFTIFEVLFLFFTTIYAGALSSVLTVPLYYPPIDSPQDLFESGVPWAADHEAWVYSLEGSSEPHIQGLLERFEIHTFDELIELGKLEDYAFPIEIMAAGHVTQTKYLSGEMILRHHVMKSELYATALVTFTRKGSTYTEQLNHLLERCLSGGLLQLWESDVTLTYLSSRLQTALKISEGSKVAVHDPTRLRIGHVQGAFILLALGLSFSLLLFLFERFTRFKLE